MPAGAGCRHRQGRRARHFSRAHVLFYDPGRLCGQGGPSITTPISLLMFCDCGSKSMGLIEHALPIDHRRLDMQAHDLSFMGQWAANRTSPRLRRSRSGSGKTLRGGFGAYGSALLADRRRLGSDLLRSEADKQVLNPRRRMVYSADLGYRACQTPKSYFRPTCFTHAVSRRSNPLDCCHPDAVGWRPFA